VLNQYVWIGIAIGVFFVGVGVSFAIFSSPDDPTSMKFTDQKLFDQMMSNNPQMTAQWMDSKMKDPQSNEQIIEQMNAMMNDSQLRQEMMQNNKMMDMMKGMIGSGMNQEMMDSDTRPPMIPNIQFNVDAPITIPMIDGYYNGNKVYFVHTEVSDKDIADMMTMMVNFPTLYVSDLTNISTDDLDKVYIFTNGITGTGPYGGGPFFFQIDIFNAVPDQEGYSQFRTPYLVTWSENSSPRLLTSVEELLESEANGELSIEKTDLVVNAPMIVWRSDDGKEQTAWMIQNMFESMKGIDGEVVNVDVDNYLATFKLKSDKQMNMMEQSMSEPMTVDSVDFSDIQVSQISETTAVVQGNTDESVFCQVEYGTNGNFTKSASDSMDMMNMAHYKHEITITDLEPNTLYNYRFKAMIDEQVFYSDINTFMIE